MPFHLIDTLKNKAGQLGCNSFVYDWSLGEKTPDRLIMRPVDPWPGNADKARELLDAADVGERTGPQWFDEWWPPEGTDNIWQAHMHGFSWLRDLRTLGGPLAREQGRLMIESWIENYAHWQADIWRSDLTGKRISMWISHYEFFCDVSEETFEEKLLASIVKQAKHLSNTSSSTNNVSCFQSTKGLLYAGIALEEHKDWIDQALAMLERAIDAQILSDGGHVSRSPEKIQDVLEVLVDIKSALNAADRTIPQYLTSTIERMSGALRFFRYGDRKLAIFHGAQEGNSDALDSLLAQAGVRNKETKSLKESGYERIEMGRSLIMMDTGKAPNRLFDKDAHASALGFEFCHGKDRILVSCGAHPTSKDWNEALRFTAAHNTACLDFRNSCEIKREGHFGRKVTQTTTHREQTDNAALLVASHNGYVPLNGITHTRKIYMGDEGHDIRGQDDFNCAFELITPVELALRFHIHPNVSISLINDGKEALLRVAGGTGWRFHFSSGVMNLEESLYLGSGIVPRKTKQIVIYGQMTEDEACIKWSLKREG